MTEVAMNCCKKKQLDPSRRIKAEMAWPQGSLIMAEEDTKVFHYGEPGNHGR